MKYDPLIHHRRSIRLPGYDYSKPGSYFITICTQEKENWLFGDIVQGEINLSLFGRIVFDFWPQVVSHFQHVNIDVFEVMPSHVHRIITITNPNSDGVTDETYEMDGMGRGGGTPHLRSYIEPTVKYKPTLGQIVGYYKYQTAKKINEMLGRARLPVWQRNYYEHIIRNDIEYKRIYEYIINNPKCWQYDMDNPTKIKTRYQVKLIRNVKQQRD